MPSKKPDDFYELYLQIVSSHIVKGPFMALSFGFTSAHIFVFILGLFFEEFISRAGNMIIVSMTVSICISGILSSRRKKHV
ncbi:hypothetical protein SAMN05660429_02972 [Thalassotalea agarivorans]|uniref:Uncharacterized protein n=1 Tax=Thalassotalea agarivorans TaxID=349064 RepID=A0A1I0HXK6_THASX|nr:hypothetical protein SAMN05660429_02972 [Thalassotalea agarivorans]